MQKLLKILLGGLLVCVALVVITAVIITSVIDPNDYKGEIESTAAKQGYPIVIHGDLAWQWFPELGISIGKTELLVDDSQQQVFASISSATASVQLLPLIKQEIIVKTVELVGLKTHLEIDKNRTGNWEVFIPESDDTTADTQVNTTNSSGASPLSLEAETIRIRDAAITFTDQQSQLNANLNDFDLIINNLNLEGKSFPVESQWQAGVSGGDFPQPVKFAGSLTSKITLSDDFLAAELADSKLAVLIENTAASVSESIVTEFSLAASSIDTNPAINGRVKIDPFNPKNIMKALGLEAIETQNPEALTRAGLNLNLEGNQNDLTVGQINLALDKTNVTGNLSVKDLSQVTLNLRGTQLNLDDYLPPESAQKTAQINTASTENNNESSSDEALDLSFLDEYAANVDIAFEILTANNLTFNKPTFKFNAGNGKAAIKEASLLLQGKKIVITGDMNKAQQFNAKLIVPTLNASQLMTDFGIEKPEMSDPKALTQVAATLVAKGTPQAIKIPTIDLLLDGTKVTGTAELKTLNSLTANLNGGKLDVDRYLPEPVDETETNNNQTSNTANTEPEEPLPFELLSDFNADVNVNFEQIKVTNLAFDNFKFSANNQDGLAILRNFSADFFQGTLASKGQLDARATPAKLSLSGNGNGIAMEPLLEALSEEPATTAQQFLIRGLANGNFSSNTQGNTATEMFENLNANVKANTQALQLVPINVEKMVCQAIALVQGDSFNTEFNWPEITKMQEFAAEITFANQVANIKTLSAGVQQINLGANGKVDLKNQTLDVRMPFSVTQADLETQGCPITNDYLVGKALSLVRCKGDLTNPLTACGIDNRAIRELVKDFAEDKAKQKLAEKTKKQRDKFDQKKNEFREKIDDKLGEGASKLLDGLFKRDKDN